MESFLANVPIEKRGGFWRRQFSTESSRSQIVFDVIFGILMPLFCYYFDPGIIRGSLRTLRGPLQPFSGLSFLIYGFSGLAILSLIFWIALSSQRKPLVRAGLGGVLLAGATVSFSIGVIILPLTVLGLLFVIGVLGFVPFVTGFVYLRNGVRAIGVDNLDVNRAPRVVIAACCALIALGLPAGAQWKITSSINQSLAQIVDLNIESIDAPVARIKRFHHFIDSDCIVRQFERETNSLRQDRLALAYKEITGEDIETRLSRLND